MTETTNVVPFTGNTTLPTDPAEALRAAIDAGVDEVIIIGDVDGANYFATSIGGERSMSHLYCRTTEFLRFLEREMWGNDND